MRCSLRFKILLVLFFFGWGLVSAARADVATRLPAPVENALKQANLPKDSVGIFVQDLAKSRPIISHRASTSMSPASVMKLLTTYAALEILGPAFTWKTEIYRNAAVEDGVLGGDLYLKGYGDPSLTLENFWALLRDVKALGITQINGDLIFDKQYFEIAASDPADFDNLPYRPYNVLPDPLLVNYKTIQLRLVPDPNGKLISVIPNPDLSQVKIVNQLQPNSELCDDWDSAIGSHIERGTNSVTITLIGSFPVACGEKSIYKAILANDDYVYSVFKQLWEAQGAKIRGHYRVGAVPGNAFLLKRHESKPLAEIVRDVNKYSNNVMARHLFLTIAAEKTGTPGNAATAATVIQEWMRSKSLSVPELMLENGSGLSRTERISPKYLGELLISAFRSSVMPEFLSSLPVVGIDGTMKKRLVNRPVMGQAHIKTGSLDGVRSIAGYVLDKQGRRIVVVCMINHARASNALGVQNALLDWIYNRPK